MKLISINTEREKHLNTILQFVDRERPDVLCLQEVCESDLYFFADIGYTGEYLPETQHIINDIAVSNGNAILSLSPLFNFTYYYYRGSEKSVCMYSQNDVINTYQRCVLFAEVRSNGEKLQVGTTHFTWTPNGSNTTPEQTDDMEKFLTYTAAFRPHIMCGDFNIPRDSNPLHARLLEEYTDTIPRKYTSSLDTHLHKLKDVPEKKHLLDEYMVDYIFTQPPYVANDVRLEFGISDHAAVVATIHKQ